MQMLMDFQDFQNQNYTKAIFGCLHIMLDDSYAMLTDFIDSSYFITVSIRVQEVS